MLMKAYSKTAYERAGLVAMFCGRQNRIQDLPNGGDKMASAKRQPFCQFFSYKEGPKVKDLDEQFTLSSDDQFLLLVNGTGWPFCPPILDPPML